MDYPLLNLLFGLALIFTVVVNIGLRVLLSRAGLPVWQSRWSSVGLILSLVAVLYIGYLFLRFMTRTFNRQIGFGLLAIGGIGALITASLYRRTASRRLTNIMFAAQMFTSLVSLIIAYSLYRSMVPISMGSSVSGIPAPRVPFLSTSPAVEKIAASPTAAPGSFADFQVFAAEIETALLDKNISFLDERAAPALSAGKRRLLS